MADEAENKNDLNEELEEPKRVVIRHYLELYGRYFVFTWLGASLILLILRFANLITASLFDTVFEFLAGFALVVVLLISIYLRIDEDRKG